MNARCALVANKGSTAMAHEKVEVGRWEVLMAQLLFQLILMQVLTGYVNKVYFVIVTKC